MKIEILYPTGILSCHCPFALTFMEIFAFSLSVDITFLGKTRMPGEGYNLSVQIPEELRGIVLVTAKVVTAAKG